MKKNTTKAKKQLNERVGANAVVLEGLVTRVNEYDNVTSFTLDCARETPNKKIAHSFITVKDFEDNGVQEGDFVRVEGYINTGSYETKEKKKVYTTDVIAVHIKEVE